MSSVPAMASGWLATTPTGRPAIVASAGDEVGGPPGAQLEELAVVDDVADDRRGRRTHRSPWRAGIAAGARAWRGRRVGGGPAGRLVVGTGGQVREQVGEGRFDVVGVGGHEAGDAATSGLGRRAAELVGRHIDRP